MSVVSRRYQPAPPPPPPDEDYWAALLAHADEADEIIVEDEIDWSELESTRSGDDHHTSNEADWQQADAAYQNDTTIDLKVIGFNRGGLLVEWNLLRGFVPASQLVNETTDVDKTPALAHYVGEMLPLRVIEINKIQNRLILSQRAAQVSSGTRANVLQQLAPNTCACGIVTNICDFGAFIDLGGIEGLIHISELSWGRVEHPAEVLKRGQQVEVYILHIDRGEGRVALSIKRLLPDPWMTVEQRYAIGQEVEGIVTSVVDFGAFACLEEGLEGLIHISELAEGHFLHPRNVVEAGQQIKVRILNIDRHARRIGLSLRGIKKG